MTTDILSVRVVNAGLYFIFIFIFISFFVFILFRVRIEHNITCYMVLSQGGHSHVTVMVTRSCDVGKVIEGSKTDDIIQHSKSILAL